MKRIVPHLILLLLFSEFGFSQTFNAEGYVELFEDSRSAKYFKMGNSSYLDYYLNEKALFNGNAYHVRIRKYSWGTIDTAYFRQDAENYYSYYPKSNQEGILLPKQLTIGQKWFASDSSWSYEIIGLNRKLKTPVEKYKNLIVVKCAQIGNKSKTKHQVYHLYYAKDTGLVASIVEGKMQSYLEMYKKNASEGERIGRRQ